MTPRALLPLTSLAGVALAAGLLAWRLGACGPFAVVARFDEIGRPDPPREKFLRGDLGIVRPGWPLADRILAYRHLTGLDMDPAALASLEAPPSPSEDGLEAWRKARIRVPGLGEGPALEPDTPLSDYSSYPRVHADAFLCAARTLEDRIRAHGAEDPHVAAWVRAQDQVFSSSRASAALPPPVQGPSWLKADRDYQVASALFYAERFEEARRAFAAIAADRSSPWRPWGAYLQARAWVREASLAPESASEEARQAKYQQARGLLEALLKDPGLAPVHAAARRYLDLVRHRIEPGAVLAETCADLLKPSPGQAFTSLLERFRTASQRCDGAELEGPPADLHAWVMMMGPEPPKDAGESAVVRWRSRRSLPWLVAALCLAPANHPERPALLEACRLEPASRGSRQTLGWYRLGMELPGLEPGARKVALEAALRRKDLPPWAENRLREQRRQLATGLQDWAAWAASRLAALEVVSVSPPEPVGPEDAVVARHGAAPLLLHEAEADLLNRGLPLEDLVAVVQSGALGAPLTRELAHSTWMRAVLLERWREAEGLRAALEPTLREALPADLAALEPVQRRFLLSVLVMEHPGLRPRLEPGVGRGNGGFPALGEVDGLRDNFWCLERPATDLAAPPWLSRERLATAREEGERLARIPNAWTYLGEGIMSYAGAHPEDPSVPRALHRCVRLTRIPSCPGPEISALSRRAFRLLHQKYPGSEWARKTPYYY